jgi:hypothetical protein
MSEPRQKTLTCWVPLTKIDLRSVGGRVKKWCGRPPIAWLLSDAAAFIGQRATVAAVGTPSLFPAEAVKSASRAIDWPEPGSFRFGNG